MNSFQNELFRKSRKLNLLGFGENSNSKNYVKLFLVLLQYIFGTFSGLQRHLLLWVNHIQYGVRIHTKFDRISIWDLKIMAVFV